MLAPTPTQYQRLEEMARIWKKHQGGDALRGAAGANPRLDVDALCFQVHALEGDDAPTLLVGALISPVSLSLVMAPLFGSDAAPTAGAQQTFKLPSGSYPFIAEVLEEGVWLWRCELLDDLSDVDSREEGSRLAQRLMDKVMTPSDTA